MKVYITYDRYEHNEWFQIYRIETNKKRALKLCKEVDLIDFITYGPDDCHSFQLQKVEMTKDEYKILCQLVEESDTVECYGSKCNLLEKIMIGIYENCDWNSDDVLLSTDGCSDTFDALRYYCDKNDLDFDDSDTRQEIEDEFFNDNDKFNVLLKEYIDWYY